MSQIGKGAVKQGRAQEVRKQEKNKKEEKRRALTNQEEPVAKEEDEWGDSLKKNKKEYLIACSNVGRLWLKPKKRGKGKRGRKSKKKTEHTST